MTVDFKSTPLEPLALKARVVQFAVSAVEHEGNVALFETRAKLRAVAISERMIQYSRRKTVALDQLQRLSKQACRHDARACARECLCEIHCNGSVLT